MMTLLTILSTVSMSFVQSQTIRFANGSNNDSCILAANLSTPLREDRCRLQQQQMMERPNFTRRARGFHRGAPVNINILPPLNQR